MPHIKVYLNKTHDPTGTYKRSSGWVMGAIMELVYEFDCDETNVSKILKNTFTYLQWNQTEFPPADEYFGKGERDFGVGDALDVDSQMYTCESITHDLRANQSSAHWVPRKHGEVNLQKNRRFVKINDAAAKKATAKRWQKKRAEDGVIVVIPVELGEAQWPADGVVKRARLLCVDVARNMDKEYRVFIVQGSSNDKYHVTAAYGRRGAALKEIKKTGVEVGYSRAEMIFNGIVNERLNHGYKPDLEFDKEDKPAKTVEKPKSDRKSERGEIAMQIAEMAKQIGIPRSYYDDLWEYRQGNHTYEEYVKDMMYRRDRTYNPWKPKL